MKTKVNKFAVRTHMALISGIQALRGYLKLSCELELHTLLNTKVSTAKDCGKNYMKVRPPLLLFLLIWGKFRHALCG